MFAIRVPTVANGCGAMSSLRRLSLGTKYVYSSRGELSVGRSILMYRWSARLYVSQYLRSSIPRIRGEWPSTRSNVSAVGLPWIS